MKKHFILFSNQFGFDLFIADKDLTGGKLEITEDKKEALVFEYGMDNPEQKLTVWKAITGYNLQIIPA